LTISGIYDNIPDITNRKENMIKDKTFYITGASMSMILNQKQEEDTPI